MDDNMGESRSAYERDEECAHHFGSKVGGEGTIWKTWAWMRG
jgi:hypothetical protein